MNILFILLICTTLWSADLVRADYLPDSSLFPNPERGWYIQNQNTVSVSWLNAERNTYGSSLLRLYVRLDPWKNGGAISDSALTSLHTTLNRVRQNGYKVILRFAYNFGDAPDAPLHVVQSHLLQLKPVLQTHEDIISVMEAGFIGYWGEWHSSSNGLSYEWSDPDSLKQYAQSARIEIIDSMHAVLPQSRSVLIRYPKAIYEVMENTWPELNASNFTIRNKSSRIGHHNDCFLASMEDWGTYSCTDWHDNACWSISATETSWLSRNSRYFPMEGETCNNDPVYSACDTAKKYLKQYHWDALHRHYDETVINRWVTEGCYAEIQRQVGYRIQLTRASITTEAVAGDSLQVSLRLVNTGWGKLYNIRPMHLILRGRHSGYLLRLRQQSPADTGLADLRRLGPGDSLYLNFAGGTIASVPLDTYDLSLHLPDHHENLRSDSRYSVRLANLNLWNSNSGENELGIFAVIRSGIPVRPYLGTQWWARDLDELPTPLMPKFKMRASPDLGIQWFNINGQIRDLLGRIIQKESL